MALINCRCRATIDTTRAARNGDDYQCALCGNWIRFLQPAEAVAQGDADARTSLETWACPGCGKAHQFAWGPAGVASESRIECTCTYLVDDGPETVAQRKWIDGPDGVKVIALVERRMQKVHTARRSFTVRELRQQGRLLQSTAYQPIR